MSKYLAFSLLVVALMIGIIAGFAVAKTAGQFTSVMNTKESKLATPTMIDDKTTVYTDQRYLQDMIEHHQAAIDMSERVLKHTSRKEIRTLANDIITAQSQEIKKMQQWLQEWQ